MSDQLDPSLAQLSWILNQRLAMADDPPPPAGADKRPFHLQGRPISPAPAAPPGLLQRFKSFLAPKQPQQLPEQPAPQMARPLKDVPDIKSDPVGHYSARLFNALEDVAEFPKVYNELQGMNASTLKTLARQFTGSSVTSKSQALDAIMRRHQSLIQAGERNKIVRERTAG
jgi:hypothetical protein